MADNVAKVTQARNFAIAQLIVGFLLFCFGIGEQAMAKVFSQRIHFGIWAGIWAVMILCLSVLSAVLSVVLVGWYSVMISLEELGGRANRIILTMILVLVILECCIVFVWVICCCSSPHAQLQVSRYSVGSGYAMTQRPGGFLVASQMQLRGGPQGGQPQALYRTTTSGYQPQRIVMPPPYEQGQYVTQQNQQESSGVPVAVRMQAGATFVADQAVSPEAQDNQPQIVLLPDSREMDDPPPPYEAVTLDYQTLEVDICLRPMKRQSRVNGKLMFNS